jgi:hypothetical protein
VVQKTQCMRQFVPHSGVIGVLGKRKAAEVNRFGKPALLPEADSLFAPVVGIMHRHTLDEIQMSR